MEIVEGIHQIDGVNANAYIVINGKELTVIDTGLPRNANKILDYVKKIGYQPSDVKTIIITHYHIDHTGSLKKIKEATNAKLATGQTDADIISGKSPMPKSKKLLFRAFSAVIKPASVPVDIVLKDNDKIATLKVIQTPGHTDGSICLLDEERKALFVGDALRADDGKLRESRDQFNLDTQQAKQSIQKIATLDFDVLLAGHGPPITQNASTQVKTFSKSLK